MTQALAPRSSRVAGAAFGALALTDAILAAGPRRWQRVRVVTKPLLMPTLAARTQAAPEDVRGRALGARAFSWGGDLALMGTSRASFLTGVAMFFGAHVSYVSAFRTRSSSPVLAAPGRRRFLAAGGLLAAGMGLAAAREDRALGVPVAAYGIALAAMVASAAAIDRDQGRDRVLAGAALFLVSDTVLGIRSFLVGEDASTGSVLEGAVMSTYTAGQWCLGEGLRRR